MSRLVFAVVLILLRALQATLREASPIRIPSPETKATHQPVASTFTRPPASVPNSSSSSSTPSAPGSSATFVAMAS
jgi:hypothetical protein